MKRQLILSSALALLMTGIGYSQDFSTEINLDLPTTTISFDEKEYNFGQVEAGDIVQHIYRFTNSGNEPLVLTNAKGSCGCTVPSWPKEPIPPGGTGAIVVEFDSKGKSGPQTKQVTITANTDPAQSIFYIKGEVIGDPPTVVENTPKSARPAVKFPVKKATYEASVYPNPTIDDFWLKVADADGLATSVEVYNGTGQLVDKKEVSAWEGQLQMDARSFAAGTYWLSLKVGDAERFSVPFVVGK
ncbi:MAG: DUF1573 domain-containing protein [Saprospiraceae bacterium]|nr:DUF1573 domain-containing protein [Saprospiraceae bacterium]MCF8250012.1 DUF1573 domain-containing protein [Saprospiraceae bacterium]MCF8278948.1 DUF1573 domain-containing protein [Bacteroidales bacterium]MCF8311025.1 DUF1573 domain-containing protein [Saprospiraceae bacterium]MCF8439639.1 DUF1573 domain-containing protein [Saprospiraceae bacterium]